MTNLDEMLATAESNTRQLYADSYEITVRNKFSGMNERLPIFGDNALGQILDAVAENLGLSSNDSKIIFENYRTKETTSDRNKLAAELGLNENDTLNIMAPCASAYEITVKNKYSGIKQRTQITSDKTLGRILASVAEDIGLKVDNPKNVFEHERTKKSTGDKNIMAVEFELKKDDTLNITDAGVVA